MKVFIHHIRKATVPNLQTDSQKYGDNMISSKSRTPLKLLVQIVLAVAVTALSSCASVSSDSSANQNSSKSDETIVLVTNWAALTEKEAETSEKVSDGCDPSLILSREDAYRCFADSGAILDPCFTAEGGLVCPDSPFLKSYTFALTPDELQPAYTPSSNGNPWGIELQNGQECVLAGGGTDSREGMRLNYFCEELMLWGDVDKSEPLWQIKSTKGLEDAFLDIAIRRAIY